MVGTVLDLTEEMKSVHTQRLQTSWEDQKSANKPVNKLGMLGSNAMGK